MRISKDAQVIYLNPPRTGSTLISNLMTKSYRHVVRPEDVCAGHETTWKREYDAYFVFQSVRHPYPRAVSIWRRLVENMSLRNAQWHQHLEGGEISFESFLHHDHPEILVYWRWMPCARFADAASHVDKVVHLERLCEDLREIPGLLSFRSSDKVRPKQDKTPWWDYYNNRCLAKVQGMFARDFSEYGYTKDFTAVINGRPFGDDFL